MATTLAQRKNVDDQLKRAKQRLQREAAEKADARYRLAGVLSTIVSKTVADERRMMNSAVKDMDMPELRAWVDYAEDMFNDLSRETDWKEWSILGSALTTAYTRLDRADG
jgi:hypothetical protein